MEKRTSGPPERSSIRTALAVCWCCLDLLVNTPSRGSPPGWVAKALDGATGRIAVRLKPLSTVRVVLVKPSNLERDWDPEYDIKEA